MGRDVALKPHVGRPSGKPGQPKKYLPRTLLIILKATADYPVIEHALACAGICRSSLRTWLQKSRDGDPDFMLTVNDETKPFHEHYQDARDAADDRLRKALWEAALGEGKHGTEIGTFRGRRVYQEDPNAILMGAKPGTWDALLKDENGNPVPESWAKYDPEMMRWLAERRLPDEFGKHQTIDVRKTSGVLVVGAKLKSADLEKLAAEPVADVEFEIIEDTDDTPA